MNASSGFSGPLQAQPSHSRHLGLRQRSRHHGRVAPARCLRCTTEQLHQLFLLPGTSCHRQVLPYSPHVGQDLVQPQQQHEQHCVESCKQQLLNSGHHPQHVQLQQQWPQLAYACSSSSSSGQQRMLATSNRNLMQSSSQQPQRPTKPQQTELDAQLEHGSLCTASSGGGDGGKTSSSGCSSISSPTSVASFDGLPPLSDLLGPDSFSTSDPKQLQQQQLQEAQPAAGAAGLEATWASDSGSSEPSPQTVASEVRQEDSVGVRAALAMLRWYKSVLSPMMQSTCRFLPTCSQYSMDSYRSYGVAKGTVLTAWRLLRCNPWGPSGYDPTQWPPPGLAWLFQYQFSAEVAVVVGTVTFVKLGHALLFE